MDEEKLVGLMANEINRLQQHMDVRFDALKQDIGFVKNDLEGVKEDLGGVTQALGGVKQDLKIVKEDLSQVKKSINALTEKVTRIDNRTWEQYDNHAEEISSLQKDVELVKEHVGLKPVQV